MITTFDKFVVALLGVVLYCLNTFFGIATDWVTPEVFNTVVSLLTALGVYIVPNKPKPATPPAQ